MASSRDPSWEATRWRLYRSSGAGLNPCTRCRAICARRTRRMSSSLFPLNMLPQMTSMRPRPLVLSTRVPPIRKKEEGRKKRGKQHSPLPFSFFLFAFRLDFEPVFLGELLNATFGIDELPLPREEWMATGTNLDADVLLRGAGYKRGAGGATDDGGLVVLGMDALFHRMQPLSRQRERGNRGTRERETASTLCIRVVPDREPSAIVPHRTRRRNSKPGARIKNNWRLARPWFPRSRDPVG